MLSERINFVRILTCQLKELISQVKEEGLESMDLGKE